MTKFLQLHILTSYPASLLNRDDVGFAKRIPFGGTTRTRVSSQCLKRHWRMFQGEGALAEIWGDAETFRSRITFEREIRTPLVAAGVPEARADVLTAAVVAMVLGESAKAAKEKAEEGDGGKKGKKKADSTAAREPIKTSQVTVLGKPELRYLLDQAKKIATALSSDDPKDVKKAVEAHFKSKDHKQNLEAMRLFAGLDAALFGRMTTGDILARCDAAIHVAHAFTVHEEMAEQDYFAAVDYLTERDDEHGSGHIGASELTSGLFYGYVVVDLDLLLSNLSGDAKLAADVLRRLVRIVATVSPGAKLGSTAPHAFAHLVLAENGKAQPRTLANAFLRDVRAKDASGSLIDAAYSALAAHVKDVDTMYGKSTDRVLAALGDRAKLADIGAKSGTLDEVATFGGDAVAGNK